MILTKEEVRLKLEELKEDISKGAIFIYPTDTVYGIGCNAKDEDAVKRLRELKERPDNLFSVIAPSVGWIRDNCSITEKGKNWLEKLPGPYTLIFNLKNKKCIASPVNMGENTLGVRIPDHWIKDFVHDLGMPIVTTSANKAGEICMTDIEDLNSKLKNACRFIIFEGKKEGSPSDIINLTKDDVEVTKR